jgi:AcrR family transcriptional regulator
MPRGYRLGRRSILKEETRARIIQAAVDLYTSIGISATTMREVARRADVAPATALNHFPTREDLDRAVLDRALAEMRPPDLSVIDPEALLASRIRQLCREAGAFFDRAAPWYRMWLREPLNQGVYATAGAEVGGRWDRLFRAALGDLADDEEALALLRATMHPLFFSAVRAGRRSIECASDLIASLLTAWLEDRRFAVDERPAV